MSGVHVTAPGFMECVIGLNVTGVVLEASGWQPVKVSTECSKATHQLGGVIQMLDSSLTTSKKPKHCKNCGV